MRKLMCRNNCMLFWKGNANLDQCLECNASRWKLDKKNEMDDDIPYFPSKKIPIKTLHYFPLVPRLQRLFMSSKTTANMRWHDEKHVNDEVASHPTDSLAWKKFDEMHPSFASEPRNVRLGLAIDGFNLFGSMSVSYSNWPIVVFPYNLPMWMYMKKPFFMLSLFIPGLEAPKDKIDVCLRPLIEELKMLWEVGIETYNASKNHNFMMRAAVLWTISDFLAYADLSGWSTKGKWDCPSCNKYTSSLYLRYGMKTCYTCHRKFLPINHKWRYDRRHFDGT